MVSHGGDFCNPHYSINNGSVLESQGGMSSTSFAEMAPKLDSCFGSGGFSGIPGGPFGFPNYMPSKDNHERNSMVGGQSQDGSDSAIGSSPNGKRRKRVADPNSPLTCDKNVEGEERKKDLTAENSDAGKDEQDERKPKTEENTSGGGKQTGKQAKDSSNSGETPNKDNYIHVRARRGQATNSHSLAERVRREKISERMRLLQELVPGCNKITGKAVMLDEIINYVQSLQQQVEFLSMKLATVNPELNIDIDRLLSKDILNSRGSSGSIFGLGPGMGSAQHFPHGMFQGTMPNMPGSGPQFASLPQSVLENELQGLFHMGFDSNSVIDNLGGNGRLKPEL